jgi:hypothetical protein
MVKKRPDYLMDSTAIITDGAQLWRVVSASMHYLSYHNMVMYQYLFINK